MLFDTAYVSFYKGIGALAGCCLAGPADVMAEAAEWRARMGGTLFGWLAYVLKNLHNFAGPLFAVSLAIVFFTFLKETGGYPGRPWGEAASAWTKEVDGWSTESCERALELLLQTDIALKDSTVSDAEQTMMSLTLALCALRPRGRKAA